MIIATFLRGHLKATDNIVPFKNIGREGLGADVRHRVFLNPKIVLLQSLGCCRWGSLAAAAAHLLKRSTPVHRKKRHTLALLTLRRFSDQAP